MENWTDATKKLPKCSSDPDALGVPVLIWPTNPTGKQNGRIDGHAYYGRRATGDRATFYKYGEEIHGVTHWMPMPKGPNVVLAGRGQQ
ncbi:MAG: DUF551 domain-containing protein [Pseudomonadota bacterium]